MNQFQPEFQQLIEAGSQISPFGDCAVDAVSINSNSSTACQDLPATLWRYIYRNLITQHEICNGMCVCKMLKAALSELLVGATLKKPPSLLCLPAIQAHFGNSLVLLEIRLHQLDSNEHYLVHNADLASLTFPQLRELRITNNVTKKLVFDEAHYPQLRKLFVERTEASISIKELLLQLPHLLTLELEGICISSISKLVACLSQSACPRLRYFSAVDIDFLAQSGPQEMLLDLPWIEHFELQESAVARLQLRAPGLMELHLIRCSNLESVLLLPDGTPPGNNAMADAVDAAVTVPGSTSQEDVQSTVEMIQAMACLGLHHGPPPARECLPCSAKRVDLMVCNLGEWVGSEGYLALIADPRIRTIDDQNDGDELQGYHEDDPLDQHDDDDDMGLADSLSEGDEFYVDEDE